MSPGAATPTTKLNTTQELVVSTFEDGLYFAKYGWTIDIYVDRGVLLLTAIQEAWHTKMVTGTVGKRGGIKLECYFDTMTSRYQDANELATSK